MKKRLETIVNALFWIFLFAFIYAALGQKLRVWETDDGLVYSVAYDKFIFVILLVDLVGKILLFYINLRFLVPKYLLKDRVSKYSYVLTGLVILSLVFSMSISYLIIWLTDEKLDEVTHLIPYTLLFHVILVPLSIAYAYIKEKMEIEKLSQHLMEEKLHAELKFLKSQINPHFLFNTLNNIYSLTRRFQDKTAANSISQLSRMMRYMLIESNSEYVQISREISYLKDFIALERLRLSGEADIKITFNEQVEKDDFQIAPMLLIPLIENTFKHGISYTQPSNIRIDITSTKNHLRLEAENTNHAKAEKRSDGIGLDNLQRRLALIYPLRHELRISKDQKKYSAMLVLNFS